MKSKYPVLTSLVLSGCLTVFPVPPPQPSMTHALASDPVGSVTPSVQGGGGYEELGRGTLGLSYTAHRRVAVGLEASASGPFGQLYGRPTVAFFAHPNITLLAGGTLGRAFTGSSGGPTYLGGDLELRVGGVVGPERVQLWVGLLGGYTAPLTDLRRYTTMTRPDGTTLTNESGWAPSFHVGFEAGVLCPVEAGSIVDFGLLAYGFYGNRADGGSFAFYDVAGLFALRVRIPTRAL